MKKILLATTALIAVGGVSAASADISITAANEFKYKSWSDNTDETGDANKTSYGNTTSYYIKAERVLDNGMTITGYTGQDGSTGAFDDHGFTVGGDFGTLGFWGSESGDAFATATDVTPDEAHTIDADEAFYATPADEHLNGADVSYLSPNISGFQFAIGVNEVAKSDDNLLGAQYSMTSGDATVTVKYASQNGGETAAGTETDADSLGFVLAYGAATVTLAKNTKEVTGGATDYDYQADSVGVTYMVSDRVTLSAYSGETDDGNDNSHKLTDTGLGVAYTVTPGLVVSLTHNDWDLKDDDFDNESGTVTSMAINLTF